MNYIYTDEVLQEIKLLFKDAYALRLLFDKSESLDVLALSFKYLDKRYDNLLKLFPKDMQKTSNISRHLGFIKRYLDKNQPENCHSDIIGICEIDIDVLENDYINYINTKFIHDELAENISTLIGSDNYDSAIRKALLTLTTSLRSDFNKGSDIDGKELVNEIFGQKGQLSKLSKDKREALRDFLSGIYGLIRNDYMHNLKEPDYIETVSILYIINFALLKIKEIKVC